MNILEKYILRQLLNLENTSVCASQSEIKKAKSRLIRNGYITTYRVKSNPRWGRNYYKVTDKGVKAASMLNRRRKRMPNIPDKIDMKMNFYQFFYDRKNEMERL